VKAREEMRQKL